MVFTYDEFVGANPEIQGNDIAYRNFTLYFFKEGNIFSRLLRGQDFFECFMSEHPGLELRIREAVSAGKVSNVEKDLYTAYLLMRELGATDDELLV